MKKDDQTIDEEFEEEIEEEFETGVNASNSDTHGKRETINDEASFNATKREFENFAQDLSSSSTNDDVTRQARELTQSINDTQRYSEQEGFHRSEAKMYQESYGSGQSFTVTERMNLRDAAVEIAEKEGYTKKEAFRIMDSQAAKDRALSNSWIRKAQQQERVHATQNMQQPNFIRLKNDEYFRDRSNSAEAGMQKKLGEFDEKMNESSSQRSNKGLDNTIRENISKGKQDIAWQKENIENTGEGIKQKEGERADRGAFVSAAGKLGNILTGNDQKE
jgi:hypothetical protein